MHGCILQGRIEESMLHCNIEGVSWEERTGTKAMSKRFRPIHCGFETLRKASDQVRTTQGYSRFGFATNEQMIARGTGISGRTSRPAMIFADFQEY
jgi:hypothetical protein